MGNVADNDHIFGSEEQKSRSYDALNCELDAALAKYATVEPRAGLEQRVLTNLQAEREKIAFRAWWRGPVTVALAAAVTIGVGVSLMWRSARTSPVVSVDRPPTSVQSGGQDGPLLAGDVRNPPPLISSARRNETKRDRRRQPTVTAGPKLEQFPSPQPMSEQEKILASYVAQYPEHAALIAEARTEALKKDRREEEETGASTGNGDSRQ
jgi:hypothetical protein